MYIRFHFVIFILWWILNKGSMVVCINIVLFCFFFDFLFSPYEQGQNTLLWLIFLLSFMFFVWFWSKICAMSLDIIFGCGINIYIHSLKGCDYIHILYWSYNIWYVNINHIWLFLEHVNFTTLKNGFLSNI